MAGKNMTSINDANSRFKKNKLNVGTFGTNASGLAMTLAPEYKDLSWDNAAKAAQLADDGEFDAIVPFARWLGYVEANPAHRTGVVFDCYTWAAGMSQLTKKCGVFATSHVPTVHPLLAAKQAATIDHISNGRFGLNVVAGWNRPELEMFGAPMREHDERYEQAAEWIDLVKRLWTSEEAFDFDGKFFKITKGISLPHPLQRPMPPIMAAGMSPRGQQFAAKYADIAYVILESTDVEENRAKVATYKKLAREEFGRELQVWSYGYVVQRETTEAAEKFHHYYANEMGDEEAVDGFMKLQTMNAKLMSPDVMPRLRTRFKAGAGGLPFIGRADNIAAKLADVSSAGLDGILLAWVDYADGLACFNRDVLPLLKQQGLRAS